VAYAVEGLGPPELWFDVDRDHADFVAETGDAAVAALLLAAMDRGADVEVDGPVSSRLLWGIRNIIQHVAVRQRPFLRTVRVHAPGRTREPGPGGSAVLTGLSCGVDSFSAIHDHLLADDVHDDDRVTHALFSHVGHHGYGPGAQDRAEQRWTLARNAARELGLPLIRVSSNTPDFYSSDYDDRLNWMSSLTLRNAAVPLLLQGGVRRFLLASSNSWREVGVEETRYMTDADPILLPALGTERIELDPVGTERTRVEKTRQIKDWPLAWSHLDVCIMEAGRNCSRCEKCLRTLLTLEVLGAVEHFADRFDMEAYRERRNPFLARVLAGENSMFLEEIRALIRETDFAVSPQVRLLSAAIRAWRVVPHPVRRKLRGLG
jgi:hypothetical protein